MATPEPRPDAKFPAYLTDRGLRILSSVAPPVGALPQLGIHFLPMSHRSAFAVADEDLVGTPDYSGLARYWSRGYDEYFGRDPLFNQAIHAIFLLYGDRPEVLRPEHLKRCDFYRTHINPTFNQPEHVFAIAAYGFEMWRAYAAGTNKWPLVLGRTPLDFLKAAWKAGAMADRVAGANEAAKVVQSGLRALHPRVEVPRRGP